LLFPLIIVGVGGGFYILRKIKKKNTTSV
jgi:uncharacterized protein YneF (UPF0154 family)